MKFSIIIPVYNRPDEIVELLGSITKHTSSYNIEVIVVEDGSVRNCKKEIQSFYEKINLKYIFQENKGPSAARNEGAKYATGEYLIFFDSDCIIPDEYFKNITQYLEQNPLDLFGGPDMADESFSPIQKAISYSMTSILTTGGIRGGNKKLDKFYPRSFNLGVRRDKFQILKGFSEDMRFGEDMDFSMRGFEAGFNVGLIPNAAVYHKRRTKFSSFYKQVFGSGTARVDLSYRHKGTLKLVHLFPSLFVIGVPLSILLAIFIHWTFILPLAFVLIAIFIDAFLSMKSVKIALLSVWASLIQTCGYGLGFFFAAFKRQINPTQKLEAFKDSFYE